MKSKVSVSLKKAKDIIAETEKNISRGLQEAAIVLTGAIQDELSTRGTGREYRRRSVVHRASAPGAPPAPDRGHLRKSIGWKKQDTFTVHVGTNVGKAQEGDAGFSRARALEYGTEKTAPRPFMRPARTKAEKQMRKAM